MNEIEELLLTAIEQGVFPGAAYAVWQSGQLVQGAVGRQTYNPESATVTPETVWDVASLSKVIATTPAFMLMMHEGHLALDQTVASVIPEFAVHGKEKITFRNLLVHNSGLVAFRAYQESFSDSLALMKAIYREKLEYETGSQMVYSDLSLILLAEAVERVSKIPLDTLVREQIFTPLQMTHTGYFRSGTGTFIESINPADCAPTEGMEPWRKALHVKRRISPTNERFIQGEVHDPAAMVLCGVAGHAGLFSTIGDLTTFMMNYCSATPLLFPRGLIQEFTKLQSHLSSRALGWDTRSPQGSSSGSYFGSRSFGHTGYTGTSIWCDPDKNLFTILLTNRVHPTSDNRKILEFRSDFHDAVWKFSSANF